MTLAHVILDKLAKLTHCYEVLEKDDGMGKGDVDLCFRDIPKIVTKFNQIILEYTLLIALDVVEIVLNYYLEYSNKLLITAYLKLHFNSEYLLQLSNAMLSQLDIGQNIAHPIQCSNLDLAPVDALI